MTAAPPPVEPDRTLLTRVRRMASLVPTSWLITGIGAALLATTAGVGGLADAPVPPTPTVKVGEQYIGSDLGITVRGVELRAERGNAALSPDRERGEKLLVVTVDAVNLFPKPRSASDLAAVSPSIDGIGVEGVEGKPLVSRADGSGGAILQPDVPAQLVLAWIVASDAFQDGDRVRLTLPDSTHYVGANVKLGQDGWTDVVVGAELTATVHAAPESEAR